MASSSTSYAVSTAPNCKYQVFLSFRGEDTRNNFTSHLYSALLRKQIKTFIDYELERGADITPTLWKVIEEVAISVVIFSENYASSPWCLDELVKIIDCKKMMKQMVLPVFYRVDPTNVAEQTGTYAVAFARHEVRFSSDKLQTWRSALTEAANLSGWDSLVIRPESKLIEDIVEDICKKLNDISSLKGREIFLGMPKIESSNWQAHSATPRIKSSYGQEHSFLPRSNFTSFQPEFSTAQRSNFTSFRPELSAAQRSNFTSFQPELSAAQRNNFTSFRPEYSATREINFTSFRPKP